MSVAQALSPGDQMGRRALPTAGSDLHQCSIIVASDPSLGCLTHGDGEAMWLPEMVRRGRRVMFPHLLTLVPQ